MVDRRRRGPLNGAAQESPHTSAPDRMPDIDPDGKRRLDAPPSLLTCIEPPRGWRLINCRELFQFRDLVRFLVLRDLKAMYAQSVLGWGWAVGQPLLTMVLFTVVFGRLARMPTDGLPAPLFFLAGIVPWTYFSAALTAATNSLITQGNLVSKVYVPRLIIPLTPILAKLVDFAVAVIVLFGFAAAYGVVRHSGFEFVPNTRLLVLPMAIGILVTFTAGAGFLLSALAVQFRDVKFALPFLTQFLMFAAPIVWPASLLPDRSRLLAGMYPMFGVIEAFRSALKPTHPVPWDLLISGGVGAALIAGIGLVVYRQQERVFADVA